MIRFRGGGGYFSRVCLISVIFYHILLLLYSWENKHVYLSSVCDGFQLQSRQAATIDGFFRDGQSVPNIWRIDTGQGTGLHHRVGMPQTNFYCGDKVTGQWIRKLTPAGWVCLIWEPSIKTDAARLLSLSAFSLGLSTALQSLSQQSVNKYMSTPPCYIYC